MLIFELARKLRGEMPWVKGEGGEPPKPPDNLEAARAQGAENRATATWNTILNRPNETTPLGSRTWEFDPKTGQWASNTAYNPQTMNLLNALFGAQGKAAGALGGLGAQTAAAYSQPLVTSGLPKMPGSVPTSPDAFRAANQRAVNAVFDQFQALQGPLWQQREGDLRNQLLQQGLDEGSAAYGRDMDNLFRQRQSATNQAMREAVLTGSDVQKSLTDQLLASNAMQQSLSQNALAQKLSLRSLPGSELAQLMALSAPQMPNFQSYYTGAGAMPTDIAGATQANYQQALDAYNAGQAGMAQDVSTGIGAAGTAIMAAVVI